MKKLVATLCPACGPECCPQILVDNSLPEEKQVEITDDFGGKISMSKKQLQAFIDQSKSGMITI